MLAFQRYGTTDLFLSQADSANPATARAALLLKDAGSNVSTFTVNTSTWTTALYVFFLPSATRDWTAFASSVRGLFTQTTNLQFLFAAEANSAVTAAASVLVSTSGGTSTLGSTAAFKALNLTINLSASPMSSPAIAWDDSSNQFTVANTPAAVSLAYKGAVSGSLTQNSVSKNLTLPLAGPFAGCVNSAYKFTLTNLDTLEAGLLYFAPPPKTGDPLTSLRYPLLRPVATTSTPLNFSFWFDVLAPLDPVRTCFLATDQTLGSYFAASNGQPFTLSTTQSGDASAQSRFVLSNRPVQTTTDERYFYLAPAGTFGLSQPSKTRTATASSASLLCGITGTEFLQVATDGSTTDTLTFIPNQPAYAAMDASSATQLDGSGGRTVTSWVQFGTVGGVYVSQPEQSPLFQQGAAARVSLSANSSNSAHLLDFLPLPSWQAAGAATFTPPIPMVPYAGIPATKLMDPFRDMETAALNPTRRNAMMAAPHNVTRLKSAGATPSAVASYAMTPQGLLAGLTADTPPAWTALQIALSKSGILQFTQMGAAVQNALKQNRIFLVDSTLTGHDGQPLFAFAGADQQVNVSDWIFNLSPGAPPDQVTPPPVLLVKFWDGQSIEDLVDDISLWSSAADFNTGSFLAADAQKFLQKRIADAKAAVAKDPDSIYSNFVQMVTDPDFAGILAVNGSLQLNALPPAIQAVMGGMTRLDKDGNRVSNLDQFRAHHIGVQINDTLPSAATPTISQSSFFALVDYEKPTADDKPAAASTADVSPLGFEVEYLRALFTNSELRTFSCQLNLRMDQLFDVGVTLQPAANALPAATGLPNVIQIQGTYQNHSGGSSEGEGVYSFITDFTYGFDFDGSAYLSKIELTKLQFSFEQTGTGTSGCTHIQARFSLWGSLIFKELDVLDLFSFDALTFADLGIAVAFDITLDPPTTTDPLLTFSPGDLRLDLGQTKPREGSTSLLSLLPFRLKSFLYSEKADQTLESLNYFTLGGVPGLSSVADTFRFALAFDLDLGSAGALVGSLAAFKFGFILGWLDGPGGGVAFGIQMPEADGKLEIKIQGVFDLIIEQFVLKYVDTTTPPMLVVAMINTSVEILGKRLPPSGTVDFALFKPSGGEAQIGWIVALDNTRPPKALTVADSSSFDLKYLGLGQRVGPDPLNPPTTFARFLDFMTTDFIQAFTDGKYNDIYHADGKWLVVLDVALLKVLELGFVFYDVTPFYSLTLNVTDLFNFEITYTKVSDTIGLYYAELSLPDKLRTFQAGAASLTLPSLKVSVYTNGNWKVDLGFPAGDDWSGCFRLDFMAGPVPVTGSGGFYLASLSSATYPVFKGTYPSILAFGLAARVGIGKDFTAGPLKAGVSLTFFGIIEGAAAYLNPASPEEIFTEPSALMLTGQFGLIGEIYGSIDFYIVKASVSVTLSASVGIVLYLEPGYGDGSIVLYVEASVSVSISVSISLFFFSITLSFSYAATFRFEWHLLGSAGNTLLLAAPRRALLTSTPTVLPLCPGLNAALPLWFLPELTVVFADTTNPGAPTLAFGLALQFDPAPKSPTYATLLPFEALTAQLTTWALISVLQLASYNSSILQAQLKDINQHPEELTGFLTYDLLLQQLAVFTGTTVTVPSASTPTSVSAATFPMPPFLHLSTSGRLDANGQPAELSCTFDGQNLVSAQYLQTVDQYLNQLFVNAAGNGGSAGLNASAATGIPLSQQIFVEYFNGLIRGAVNALLQTLENADLTQQNLDTLICAAVASGSFASLAGQMSSMFRGGARLPYTAGLTLPQGAADTTTNPLQSLLWQQFPVGRLSPVADKAATAATSQYSLLLTQPDTAQTWITATVDYALTNLTVDPYTNLTATQITQPGSPTLIPFTNTGPQAFSFANRTTWTQAGTVTGSLCPFPPPMLKLTGSQAAPLDVLIQSRSAGKAYAGDGQPLPPSAFLWATTVQITAKQIPADSTTKPQTFLPNVYSISGSSQAEQALLAAVLGSLGSVSGIQVLYQTAAGAAGLSSRPVNATDLFVLRTNTTTVSAPPVQLLFNALDAPPVPTISVGANASDFKGFLQILEEVSITNAPGYYLHYQAADKSDLPADLFTAGPAPLTLLITFTSDSALNTPASPAQAQPFYNTLILNSPDASLVYYASTVAPQFDLQYAAVAPGSVGAELVRSQTGTLLSAPDGTQHTRPALLGKLSGSVTEEHELTHALAAAGAASAQLNSLYNLLTFQVESSTGFIQSNLSAPVQPQAELGAGDTAPRHYRAFVPLYNLATANQSLSADTPPNRYSSLGSSYAVDFLLTDAFGNQLPGAQQFTGKNLYFDSIVPLDSWQGVVPSFSFSDAAAGTVTLTLTPSETAFSGMSTDRAAAALTLYRTISTQLGAPGVSFSVGSSLSLQADGSFQPVTLSAAQTASINTLVTAIETYLAGAAAGSAPAWTVAPVALIVALPATVQPLPAAFGLSVQFSIERDSTLIDPSLIGPGGVIKLPSAQRVTTTIAPAPAAQADLPTFADQFATAFPALLLALGLGGATGLPGTAAAKARKALKATLQAADPAVSNGSSGSQALWAVSKSLVAITISNPTTHQPRYSSPKPLLNALESGTVPMPTMPTGMKQLGQSQSFVDIDLDALNTSFFAAVDQVLQPASAAALFQQTPAAYTTLAVGREQLANGYSQNEVDWLFAAGAPFTGSADDLTAAQDFIEQQCRAALLSAYSIDTILQFPVSWAGTLPTGAAGNISLFGSVQPVPASTSNASGQGGKNTAFLCDQIEVPLTTATGRLTFAYSSPNVVDDIYQPVPLQFLLSHLQIFTAPDTGGDEARPSLWLQLVPGNAQSTAVPSLVFPIGAATTPVEIPIVFRQFPTPPTLLSQTGVGAAASGLNAANALTQAAQWIYSVNYQAQLTQFDRLSAYLTWNSTVAQPVLRTDAAASGFTLFQALCRFTAAYPILQPYLLAPTDPNYPAAAAAFASLVSDVAGNSDWNPSLRAALTGAGKAQVTDLYTITDFEQQDGSRLLTLNWQGQPSSMPNGKAAIQAISSAGVPFTKQKVTPLPNGMKDAYTAAPPVVNNWVSHQLTVSGIDVLTAENARPAIQIERNLITLLYSGTSYSAQNEFVYMTPFVEATQPVTPFLDNADPINIARLPALAAGSACSSNKPATLCQRLYNLLMNLLTVSTTAGSTGSHRLKIGCSFSYPLTAAAGLPAAKNPLMPEIPVVLARSFDILDSDQPAEVGAFAVHFATAIQSWTAANQIQFGRSPSPVGGELVFDVTLFAQLSGNSRPLLRLRNLQLALGDVDPTTA